MPDDPLHVLMEGRHAAVIEKTASSWRLTYDAEYSADQRATPLSVLFPTPVRQHDGDNINTWLWGLLPDNERVIDRWAREYRVSASSAISLLASPVGHDCAGAVQFAREADVAMLLARKGAEQPLSDGDVENLLLQLRADETAWLGEGELRGQFSLAGAQSKTALLWKDERWWRPSGSAATSHIFKPGVVQAPDGTKLTDQALNEHLCMDSARRAGLIVPKTRILRFGEAEAIVVARYDRVPGAQGFLRRVHQEDFCQALGVATSRKYEVHGGPGVGDIAKLLVDILPPDVLGSSLLRFVDALAWNWLIGAPDAHAKNYSLLLQGRAVRFAPLYDLASGLPYWHPKEFALAMRLGDSYEVWPWSNKWPRVAAQLDLDANVVQERVLGLVQRAPQAFEDAIAEPAVVALESSLPRRLTDAVTEQCARCEAVLQ